MWSVALGSLDHASLASARAPIWGGCCLADWHLRRRLHPMTGFFRAPPYGDRTHQRSQTAGGSASPQGEARRERAGKAARSDRRAREDYGWGWAGRFNQTVPPNPPNTPAPPTPAAARAGTAKPGAGGAGKAKRSARRAREDYGWGWAGRCNQTSPPNPPRTRSPNTRGSTSRTSPPTQHLPNGRRQREPKGRSPARTRRQGRAQRMPRQGGLRAGVGGRCN